MRQKTLAAPCLHVQLGLTFSSMSAAHRLGLDGSLLQRGTHSPKLQELAKLIKPDSLNVSQRAVMPGDDEH